MQENRSSQKNCCLREPLFQARESYARESYARESYARELLVAGESLFAHELLFAGGIVIICGRHRSKCENGHSMRDSC